MLEMQWSSLLLVVPVCAVAAVRRATAGKIVCVYIQHDAPSLGLAVSAGFRFTDADIEICARGTAAAPSVSFLLCGPSYFDFTAMLFPRAGQTDRRRCVQRFCIIPAAGARPLTVFFVLYARAHTVPFVSPSLLSLQHYEHGKCDKIILRSVSV